MQYQAQAQTEVIEKIADMMKAIAGLGKRKRRRRRRFNTNQPIVVRIGNESFSECPAIAPHEHEKADKQANQHLGQGSVSMPLSKAGIMDLILTKLQVILYLALFMKTIVKSSH